MSKAKKTTSSTTEMAQVALEDAIKALETNLQASNPYTDIPARETTKSAKIRLGLAHRFETARGKAEDAHKRSVGIVGFYGRVPATIDAFGQLSSKLAKDATYKFQDLVILADLAFKAHNPDRKHSANSAKLYAQEVSETLRLLGLVTYNPKQETYSITPQLFTILQSRK